MGVECSLRKFEQNNCPEIAVYIYSVCDYPKFVLNHKFNILTVQNPGGGMGRGGGGILGCPSLYETLTSTQNTYMYKSYSCKQQMGCDLNRNLYTYVGQSSLHPETVGPLYCCTHVVPYNYSHCALY